MEKPSASNVNRNSILGRRIRLIPVTPRPALPPPSPSSSSTSSLIPSLNHLRATINQGVLGNFNQEKARRHTKRGASTARARSPRGTVCRETRTPDSNCPAAECVPRTSRPPEMFGGNLYANIIREAMEKIPPISEKEEEKDMSSEEIHSNESGGCLNGRRKGKTFEVLAESVIREMREAEEERGKRPEGMTQSGEPSRQAAGVNDEEPHEGLIREMSDLTGTDDEADAEEDEWRKTLEETVDTLVAEVTEQREQTTRLVNLVERIVSWMDRETQSSNNPSPATSVAPLADPQQPNTDIAGPSRNRKETATTSQPPSGAKKARRSDSPGSQRGN